MMNVTVMIPTYNEKENLEKLIPILYGKIYPMRRNISFSTLIVDDNSADGTRAILTKFLRKYPHLFISYGDKCGIGSAMKRGYRYAVEKLHPDAVVTYEADFVFSPETIIDLIDRLSGADAALASRENVSDFYSSSRLRKWGHFVANTLIAQWIAGMTQVSEHTAAGRAISVKNVLTRIDFETLPNGYSFFPSILYQLAKLNCSFIEIPVTFRDRRVGTSKMQLSKGVEELRDSLHSALRYRFSL